MPRQSQDDDPAVEPRFSDREDDLPATEDPQPDDFSADQAASPEDGRMEPFDKGGGLTEGPPTFP